MVFHKDLSGTNIHTPITWTYANSTERTTATGFVTADIGKFARQTDDDSLYMLTAITPAWAQVTSGTITLTSTNYTGSDCSGSDSNPINRTLNTGSSGTSIVIVERETLHPTDDYTVVGATITFLIPIYNRFRITVIK